MLTENGAVIESAALSLPAAVRITRTGSEEKRRGGRALSAPFFPPAPSASASAAPGYGKPVAGESRKPGLWGDYVRVRRVGGLFKPAYLSVTRAAPAATHLRLASSTR